MAPLTDEERRGLCRLWDEYARLQNPAEFDKLWSLGHRGLSAIPPSSAGAGYPPEFARPITATSDRFNA
ncbi:MAG: hypothetical protein M1816_002873 [Peltula sp. TS41687]|nr:MAG: hypothetical protein M1816_002873 [Peltula sp. TS41687]